MRDVVRGELGIGRAPLETRDAEEDAPSCRKTRSARVKPVAGGVLREVRQAGALGLGVELVGEVDAALGGGDALRVEAERGREARVRLADRGELPVDEAVESA